MNKVLLSLLILLSVSTSYGPNDVGNSAPYWIIAPIHVNACLNQEIVVPLAALVHDPDGDELMIVIPDIGTDGIIDGRPGIGNRQSSAGRRRIKKPRNQVPGRCVLSAVGIEVTPFQWCWPQRYGRWFHPAAWACRWSGKRSRCGSSCGSSRRW